MLHKPWSKYVLWWWKDQGLYWRRMKIADQHTLATKVRGSQSLSLLQGRRLRIPRSRKFSPAKSHNESCPGYRCVTYVSAKVPLTKALVKEDLPTARNPKIATLRCTSWGSLLAVDGIRNSWITGRQCYELLNVSVFKDSFLVPIR